MTIKCLNCGNERDTLSSRMRFCCPECCRAHEAKMHPQRARDKSRRYELREKLRKLNQTARCKRCGQEFHRENAKKKYCYDPECRLAHHREENRLAMERVRRRRGISARIVTTEAQSTVGVKDVLRSPMGKTDRLIERLISENS